MATTRRTILIVLMLITSLLPLSISWRSAKLEPASILEPEFKEGDLIPLFANKVFRRSDGCEAQSYFDLPFCPPGDPITNRKKTLEDILKGDCLTRTQYQLKFKVETVGKILCERNLTIDEVKKFRHAISKEVDYHMYYNNILLRGVVGFVTEKSPTIDSRTRYYLVKHVDFYPHYYENQVVDIYSLPYVESAVDVTEDAETRVKFTYSVFWKDSKINPTKFVSRNETAILKKYSEEEGGIRWADSLIFWAVMLFFWLWVLATPIAAYLEEYFTRHPPINVTEFVVDGIPHQIHGDVCWRPPYSSLLGAILGIGTQQLITICFLFALFHKGILYPCNLGQLCLNKYVLALYFVTSEISGYTATLFHSQYSAHGWKECIFQTAMLFFVPVFLTVVVVNMAVTSMFADLPEFTTPLEILITWGLGSSIFITLGGGFGNLQHESQEPCASRRTQKVIPWWESTLMSTPAQMFLGGLFPFLALIFWDMDELYASLLFHKVCGAFSALLTSFISVIIMTIVMAVLLTYYQLSKEDFNWWWRSVFRGGSTAIFIFAYGIYFQYRVKQNYGALFIFLCYNACFCYALFLVLGTVSFYASSYVHYSLNPGLHKRE